jgi:hypothetical protein
MNLLAAMLHAVAGSVLIGIALAFCNGALTPAAAVIALSGGFLIGTIGWWCGRGKTKLPRPGVWAVFSLVLFSIFSLRAFLWLIFREGDDLRVLSPNNLGDMPLHITFIRYLANGAPFWPDSPIFSAGKLTYAVGMDLFNALLSLVGVDTVRGLIWTGLLGALATGVALLRWGGAFTVFGFLFNGGLAVLACIVSAPDAPFFHDWQAGWAWKSMPLSILVTQRGFLFALPAGLLLLTSWRTRFLRAGDGWKMPFPGELLLYAVMPVFHIHTFLALSTVLGALLIARPAARVKIARLIAAAFLPATALCWLTLGMFQTNAVPIRDGTAQSASPRRPPVNALGWQPGWMVDDESTAGIWRKFAAATPAAKPFAAHGKFLIFWFGNFGVLPFLLVPFLLALLRPVLPRGPSRLAGWIIFAGIIILTPVLGEWNGYQEKSLGVMLAGGHAAPDIHTAIVLLLALVTLVAGIRMPSRDSPSLRHVLILFAGLLFCDVLLTALHTWEPRIPLLRANAAPLLLATFAFVVFLRRISRQPDAGWPAFMAMPALFLFFVCCNIRFTSWDWDNIKLMLWSYVIVLPALWESVLMRWHPWCRAAACAALFVSGCVSLLGDLGAPYQPYTIAQFSTLDAVGQAVREIPITETFAANPTYNHALLLCGRKVVMGYEGHLSSHGIQYEQVRGELDALMSGAPGWRLHAERLGSRYLFFGPGERQTWPDSAEPWRTEAVSLAAGEWGEIFDLRAVAPMPRPAGENPTLRLAPPRLQPPSARQ